MYILKPNRTYIYIRELPRDSADELALLRVTQRLDPDAKDAKDLWDGLRRHYPREIPALRIWDGCFRGKRLVPVARLNRARTRPKFGKSNINDLVLVAVTDMRQPD
jgi:hypothetical protein